MKSPVLFVLLGQFVVQGEGLVTANVSAPLEFNREMLAAPDAYPAEYIESRYQFFKQGT